MSQYAVPRACHKPVKFGLPSGIRGIPVTLCAGVCAWIEMTKNKTTRRKFLARVITANLFELGAPICPRLERRLVLQPFRSFLRGKRTQKAAPDSSSLEFQRSTV